MLVVEHICPRTTANMVNVQHELKGDGITPQIVSFIIDSAYDTPEILKGYAFYLINPDGIIVKNMTE